jgi:hypothetical protein
VRGGLLLGTGGVLLLAVVIVYGHQTGNGPDVSADDMDEVEKCLA